MKNIIKIFVEIYVLDMEGRCGRWMTVNKTYEEAAAKLNNWTDAARVVEKTFDPETFVITEREIKRTERVFEGFYWKGKTREVIH